ncbi:MAG TPA: FAD-dependent oxidoreductase, partial [Vicinamibacteria bacterium]|nr:FAD-dependent oxidoreductase [Vicinamibacteria bacterium]
MAPSVTREGELDVVVVGGGNAALCAALAARESGARVVLLEKAPPHERGGNSFFTAGGFRFTHTGLDDLRRDVLVDLTDGEAAAVDVPPYTTDQFLGDLMRLTEGLSDPDLADVLIR